MHHEVVNPDQKDQCIDWQNPQHEHEYRMGIVGEVKMRSEPLSSSVEAKVKKSETGRKKKKKKHTVSLAYHWARTQVIK